MWWVRPATMTRRTERLSRLLRLWFTTMPNDFATIPRLSRLSPERLCDFLARVCDYDRAADLPLRGRRLFHSRQAGRRVLVGAAGVRPDRAKLTHNCNDVSIFFLVVVYLYIVNVTYREFIEVHYTYVLIKGIYKKSRFIFTFTIDRYVQVCYLVFTETK